MDIVYYIRSCDLLRHFTDDVYMACRLLQWVVTVLNSYDDPPEDVIVPGELVMHISSLHYFRGDYPRVQRMLEEWDEYYNEIRGAAI